MCVQGIVVITATDSLYVFFFSSRRRHTRSLRDWSSDVCSSDLAATARNGTMTKKYSAPCSQPAFWPSVIGLGRRPPASVSGGSASRVALSVWVMRQSPHLIFWVEWLSANLYPWLRYRNLRHRRFGNSQSAPW